MPPAYAGDIGDTFKGPPMTRRKRQAKPRNLLSRSERLRGEKYRESSTENVYGALNIDGLLLDVNQIVVD
jgi:hypothetical protein